MMAVIFLQVFQEFSDLLAVIVVLIVLLRHIFEINIWSVIFTALAIYWFLVLVHAHLSTQRSQMLNTVIW